MLINKVNKIDYGSISGHNKIISQQVIKKVLK